VDDLEQRVQDQIAKAAEVGHAAFDAARRSGGSLPWKRLTEERQAQLIEAAAYVRTALSIHGVLFEPHALAACNTRRILAVSVGFVHAAAGYFRETGVRVGPWR